MVLMRGATGDPVKDLQRQLNKVGSLLVVDGDLGPATEAAIADARLVLRMPGPPVGDDALVAELRKLPEPSPDVTSPGVTFIGREEVTGPREYRRLYSHPIWPTRASGITIGIGYDLSAVTRVKFEADWGGLLSDNAIDRLGDVTSVRGTEKRRARVEDIEILLHIPTMYVGRAKAIRRWTPCRRPGEPLSSALCSTAVAASSALVEPR
jgi:peptidoglycan hydrolase-like protein with peptidoglycan-binding domain